MKLKNLREFNHIYDFQDTIILCEIFEQQSSHLQDIFKYNPTNVILQVVSVVASIGIKVSVVLLFLLTVNMLENLKKTLIGGFSCVNTRLASDTEVLINKNEDDKVVFDLLIDGKK